MKIVSVIVTVWFAGSIAFTAMWAVGATWLKHRSRLHRAQEMETLR